MAAVTIPLSHALEDPRAADAAVAFGRGGTCLRRDLDAPVRALAAALAPVGGRWLLCSEDAYAAAVALTACAHTRCVAVLPPNREPDTLRRLAAGVRGVLADPGAGLGELGRAVISPLAAGDATARELPTPDRDAAFAEFHTSGSAGEGRALLKTLRHLEAEVETLEERFGNELPSAAHVFATVPYQHIYGLLFRVLWPLASGRPFQRETLLHPQEILPRMAETAACALVTTPAHLKRMCASGELRQAGGSCRAVFSSGGLLDADVAESVQQTLGRAPFEVFGSTETGGVAVRQRDSDGETWRPLPGVHVEREADGDRLVVRSPFVSVGQADADGRRRFTMGDQVKLAPQGAFLLLGRADRTVKIGEKRLSLPEMERDLERHAWVAEAALLVLEQASEARVHAALVPSPEGRRALRDGGRRALGRALQAHLAGGWDRVLLPRAWRVVDELPRDARGKLPVAALAQLFDRGREPVLLSETRDPSRLERRLLVPGDLAFLEGHFEGQPLVAGVVQLRWVLEAAQDLLARRPRLRALAALKFPEPLLPGQAFTLTLELSADEKRLRFSLGDGEHRFASGRCLLAGGETG